MRSVWEKGLTEQCVGLKATFQLVFQVSLPYHIRILPFQTDLANNDLVGSILIICTDSKDELSCSHLRDQLNATEVCF